MFSKELFKEQTTICNNVEMFILNKNINTVKS